MEQLCHLMPNSNRTLKICTNILRNFHIMREKKMKNVNLGIETKLPSDLDNVNLELNCLLSNNPYDCLVYQCQSLNIADIYGSC